MYKLTVRGPGGDTALADPSVWASVLGPIRGLEPVSELVAAARRAAGTGHDRARRWVPDETWPEQTLEEIAPVSAGSGRLTLRAAPDAEITNVPVLEFSPHPAHPATGEAWAEVMYLSGRGELPLGAVVCFEPDPEVRQRWEAAFRPSD